MPSNRAQKVFRPWATASVMSFTALFTTAQLFVPTLLSTLQRQPTALRHHEYWRLVTPLLVHSDGWKQISFNFLAIGLTGFFVEAIYGVRMFLFIYLVSGIIGELFGLLWQPSGAGASVAGAGLLGALAVALLFRVRAWQPKVGAYFIILGAPVLTGLRDIHGPPMLVGICIGLIGHARDAKGVCVPRRDVHG